ncbi:MAG: hypothetical protein KAI08_12660, partial [Bacteroidales bacterium]|nr:hypothetical protein [Bacteroidales bacterium]
DGENILPILEGTEKKRSPIGFLSPLPSPLRKQETQADEQFALIGQQYKIISMDDGNSFQLFDLIADAGESTDLAMEHADVLNDMKDDLLAWVKSCKAQGNQ